MSPGLQLAEREPLERRARAEVHRREMHRAVRGLADQLAVGVEDRVGVVDHVVDDRRERRPLKDLAHALGRVLERAAQDLERDRIQLRWPGLVADAVMPPVSSAR